MGWVDAIKFRIGATIAHSTAGAKSCSISGKSDKVIDSVLPIRGIVEVCSLSDFYW